ncbi:hypothetical protein EDC01DRAFT_650577, partial [Geopyxis carbonaria]
MNYAKTAACTTGVGGRTGRDGWTGRTGLRNGQDRTGRRLLLCFLLCVFAFTASHITGSGWGRRSSHYISTVNFPLYLRVLFYSISYRSGTGVSVFVLSVFNLLIFTFAFGDIRVVFFGGLCYLLYQPTRRRSATCLSARKKYLTLLRSLSYTTVINFCCREDHALLDLLLYRECGGVMIWGPDVAGWRRGRAGRCGDGWGWDGGSLWDVRMSGRTRGVHSLQYI